MLVFLFSFLTGCGGGDNTDQIGLVTDLRVDPNSARIGETISVRVDFEPSQRENISGDSATLLDTDVTLILPRGIDYITDSSDFDGSDISGFKMRNPNTVEICPNGSRALTYRFSSGELTDNENSIRLNALAFEGGGEVIFYALADDVIFDPCDIGVDDSDSLIIFP